MRISVLSPDLSSNSMARVCPIAQVLSLDHEVEIVGFDSGDGFFEPYKDEFEYTALPVGRTPVSLVANVLRADRQLSGDVCYAFRPQIGSLGVALLHKRRIGTPVVLDVEDIVRFKQYRLYRQAYNSVYFSGSPTGGIYALALERLLDSVDEVTVTSTYLKEQYGGTVLPYGPDEEEFNPSVEPPVDLDGTEHDTLLVFVGTIRHHKGLDILGEALVEMDHEAHLLVAGYDPHDQIDKIRSISGKRVSFVGPIKHGDVPSYLAAADVIPIPQRRTQYTEAQVPNKLFEAMAMGKPIVATRVGDIPRILGDTGLVTNPSAGALADALDVLAGDPDRARALGENARERYVSEFSRTVLRNRLDKVLGDAVNRKAETSSSV